MPELKFPYPNLKCQSEGALLNIQLSENLQSGSNFPSQYQFPCTAILDNISKFLPSPNMFVLGRQNSSKGTHKGNWFVRTICISCSRENYVSKEKFTVNGLGYVTSSQITTNSKEAWMVLQSQFEWSLASYVVLSSEQLRCSEKPQQNCYAWALLYIITIQTK